MIVLEKEWQFWGKERWFEVWREDPDGLRKERGEGWSNDGWWEEVMGGGKK
jgi:hypothetical protein